MKGGVRFPSQLLTHFLLAMLTNWNHSDNNSFRGAPLGQPQLGTAPASGISLRHIALNKGGYDKAGTYWGIGQPLYQASAPGYCRHTRAASRHEAADKLGLVCTQLIRS
jgi:hypothetical protein